MRSRQYLIPLKYSSKTISLRIYADRSVESGYITDGNFEHANGEHMHTRPYVTQVLLMAREFEKVVTRENL